MIRVVNVHYGIARCYPEFKRKGEGHLGTQHINAQRKQKRKKEKGDPLVVLAIGPRKHKG